MSHRYIPPHLRSTSQGSGSGRTNASLPSYPVSVGLRGGDESSGSHSSRPDPLSQEGVHSPCEIACHFCAENDHETKLYGQKKKTLHDSAATPGKLAYVLLFIDANPRWESDGIIFTKSSLDLLPAELVGKDPALSAKVQDTPDTPILASDTAKNKTNELEGERGSEPVSGSPTATASGPQTAESNSVAVFTQLRCPPYDPTSSTFRSFQFSGYYRLTRLQFLQPHSNELEKMLHQKWTLTNSRTGYVKHGQRDPERWKESLKLKWAVMKFEKDDQADKERGKPQIARIEVEEGDDVGKQEKSVNELLNELRLKDTARAGDATK